MKIENIKFKAKRLDGKGWAIGDLLHSYENGAIIVPVEGGGAFSVDPSTDEIVKVLSGRFNQEGYEGWELVQWNIMPPAALLTASTTHCCDSIYILATFKKKLRV